MKLFTIYQCIGKSKKKIKTDTKLVTKGKINIWLKKCVFYLNYLKIFFKLFFLEQISTFIISIIFKWFSFKKKEGHARFTTSLDISLQVSTLLRLFNTFYPKIHFFFSIQRNLKNFLLTRQETGEGNIVQCQSKYVSVNAKTYLDSSPDTCIFTEGYSSDKPVVKRDELLLEIERSLVPVYQPSHQLEGDKEVDRATIPN